MARSSRSPALLVLVAITAVGCQGKEFSAPRRLGGQPVSAETLNRGHLAYQKYWSVSHDRRWNRWNPDAELV